MATIKKAWATQAQVLGSGGSGVTLSGTTEQFSSDVDLETDGYEGAHVVVDIDYEATPADQIIISLYGSLDGTNWDDSPIWSMKGDNTVDPQQLSFVVKDLAHFRIGVVQDTGTDTSNTVAVYAQRWNFEST